MAMPRVEISQVVILLVGMPRVGMPRAETLPVMVMARAKVTAKVMETVTEMVMVTALEMGLA